MCELFCERIVTAISIIYGDLIHDIGFQDDRHP